jgi:hypothetical protein
MYIQHNYVIYYYICVDVDSQNLFAEQMKKETTTTPLSHDDYYYYADVPTPPTPTLLTADATRVFCTLVARVTLTCLHTIHI